MDEVPIAPQPVDRFVDVVGAVEVTSFVDRLTAIRDTLGGRTVWHVNSTAEGGGVAEMLQSILGYPLGCDVPVRWQVIDGSEEFFEITKRLHHLLHGSTGDGGPLGAAERARYDQVLAQQSEPLLELVKPDEPVVLHDPQTLGMAPRLATAGARVIWSCHIGADEVNSQTRTAWQFLAPYLGATRRQVFSRQQYAAGVPELSEIVVIPPCIDAFSAKNQEMDDEVVGAVLDAAGLIPDGRHGVQPTFRRLDGRSGVVRTRAEMVEDAPVPPAARVVTQVSRWDPLKDHVGVLTGFVDHCPTDADVHLVLAGPTPESVGDDPESRQTLDEVLAAWRQLPPADRARVHIACLPMVDVEENAAIVNALQRRAAVVVQKSLAEGFGLTVAEAMWKARPTLGSRVGGIQDQIEPGVSSVLVDPDDLAGFGVALAALLRDRQSAEALGRAARDRVCAEYLALHHLDRFFALIGSVARDRAGDERAVGGRG
jgi:trehalose synthase